MSIFPRENAVRRNAFAILHDFLVLDVLLVVHIIRNQHVKLHVFFDRFSEKIHHLRKRLAVQPIIAVNYAHVMTGRMFNPRIYGLSVSPVFLMHGRDYPRIACLVIVNLFRCLVLRTVIDQNDFNVRSAQQQWLNAAIHVGCWIVTRHYDA